MQSCTRFHGCACAQVSAPVWLPCACTKVSRSRKTSHLHLISQQGSTFCLAVECTCSLQGRLPRIDRSTSAHVSTRRHRHQCLPRSSVSESLEGAMYHATAESTRKSIMQLEQQLSAMDCDCLVECIQVQPTCPEYSCGGTQQWPGQQMKLTAHRQHVITTSACVGCRHTSF